MSKKIYYPKRKALLSLQLWRDKEGALNFLQTCQEGDIASGTVDYLSFGTSLAESNLINKEEKECLVVMFKEYIRVWENIK